jgi:hypothetical protein
MDRAVLLGTRTELKDTRWFSGYILVYSGVKREARTLPEQPF